MDSRADLLWDALNQPDRDELAARLGRSLESYLEGDHTAGLNGMNSVLEAFGLHLAEADVVCGVASSTDVRAL